MLPFKGISLSVSLILYLQRRNMEIASLLSLQEGSSLFSPRVTIDDIYYQCNRSALSFSVWLKNNTTLNHTNVVKTELLLCLLALTIALKVNSIGLQ